MNQAKKVWTRSEINALLKRSVPAVERAMIVLYDLQRPVEKQINGSVLLNLQGFCAFSAKSGSKFARAVISRRAKGIAPGRCLYGSWLTRARQIALRHSMQLVQIANAE